MQICCSLVVHARGEAGVGATVGGQNIATCEHVPPNFAAAALELVGSIGCRPPPSPPNSNVETNGMWQLQYSVLEMSGRIFHTYFGPTLKSGVRGVEATKRFPIPATYSEKLQYKV